MQKPDIKNYRPISDTANLMAYQRAFTAWLRATGQTETAMN